MNQMFSNIDKSPCFCDGKRTIQDIVATNSINLLYLIEMVKIQGGELEVFVNFWY